jgi:hypothetical protein
MIHGAKLIFLFVAQSTVPQEIIQLARIKHDMSAILAKVPDYTCTETVERSVRKKGTLQFKVTDALRLEVAFIGGQEVYSWHGARRIDRSDPIGLVGSGVVSNGEFATHARAVFHDNIAKFRYIGADTWRGEAALRWDYSIPYLFSGWTLSHNSATTRVTSNGSFQVSAKSLELLHLEIDASQIEAGFPISAAHTSIEYAKIRLGSKLVLVPQTTDLLLTESDGSQHRNLAQFSQCHEYSAEAAISFTDPPQEPTSNEALVESRLPPSLSLDLTLDSPIDSDTALEGDEIVARLDHDVRWKQKVIVPAGALVRGRIRRLERHETPRFYWVVGMEFVEIEFDHQRIVFIAKLDRLDGITETGWSVPALNSPTSIPEGPQITEFETSRFRELPGVGTLFLDGRRVRLESGLRLHWRTIE